MKDRNKKGQFIKGKHYSTKTQFKKGVAPWNKGIKGLLSGANSPHWKGGKPKCKICNKQVSAYLTQYCIDCLPITNQSDNSPNWKGEDASYSAKHSWITRRKGSPEQCLHCGSVGKKIQNRWNIDWANIDHKYRRNLGDYIPLCKQCHTKYDLKNNLSLVGNNQYTNL